MASIIIGSSKNRRDRKFPGDERAEGETLRDAEYMIQNIMLNRELPVLTTDGQYQCLSYNDGVFQAEGFFKENQDLWEILVSRSRKNQLPVLYLEKGNWGYAGGQKLLSGTGDAGRAASQGDLGIPQYLPLF